MIQGKNGQMRSGFAKEEAGLYYLVDPPMKKKCLVFIVKGTTLFCNASTANTWHNKLGHFPINKLHMLGIGECHSFNKSHVCEVCHLAKHKRKHFHVSLSRTNVVFDLLHVDIWGPFFVCSMNGEYYFLTVVDDCSMFTWIYLMKQKSETKHLLMNFCAYTERHFDIKVKAIRSDNGLEFQLLEFYGEQGILHKRTCVETPQQNAVVERKHQHILNVARALRFQSGVPLKFWGHCVLHAVYLINRLPSPITGWKSPHEILFKSTPEYQYLRVFGCLCFAATLRRSRSKFDERGRKCVFIGFPANVKGYILYDLASQSIFISRDVDFYEDHFPFTAPEQPGTVTINPLHSPVPLPIHYSSQEEICYHNHNAKDITDQSSSNQNSSGTIDTTESHGIPHRTRTPEIQNKVQLEIPIHLHDETCTARDTTPTAPVISPRRSTRIRHKPVKFQDYQCAIYGSMPTMQVRTSPHTIDSVMSYNHLPPTHKSFVDYLSANDEPQTYKEAVKHKC